MGLQITCTPDASAGQQSCGVWCVWQLLHRGRGYRRTGCRGLRTPGHEAAREGVVGTQPRGKRDPQGEITRVLEPCREHS